LARLEIDIVDDLDPLSEAWDELAAACRAPPFCRPGWFEAFAEAFGTPTHALVARRAGELIGIVPLGRRRSSLRSPTNWHTPGFEAVVLNDAVAASMGTALVRRAPACLDLSFVDPSAPFAAALLEEARTRHRHVIARVVQRSPYVVLDGDFPTYRAARPHGLRRALRRRRRQLEASGHVEVVFEDGTQGLEALLDEGFAIEGSGWKTARGTAIVQNPHVEGLYRSVARWAAGRGWLELGFLRVNGVAAAFSLALHDDRTVWCLKIGFNPAFRTFSPGTVLLGEVIQRAYARGFAVFDFLGADDPYKLNWTDRVREAHRIQVFDRSPVGIAGYAVWQHGRPLARRLRARPIGERERPAPSAPSDARRGCEGEM
jgi:CelD/BcsL family acetyltransferase involved in cellulose biosynthesis